MNISFRRDIIKPFASLKLAVLIITALGAITAWGTFVEAELDDVAARKIVYTSVWMYTVMTMLAFTLIAVMIDRYPWKKKHIAFLLAHVGILVLMAGSLVTQKYGIDGSIALEFGESSSQITIRDEVVVVNASMNGTDWRPIFGRRVDFFLDPPTEAKPFLIPMAAGDIKVVEYLPYAFRDVKMTEGDPNRYGAAVRFQLQNERVNMSEWIMQPGVGRMANLDLGPARVVLTTDAFVPAAPGNMIVLRPLRNEPGTLAYEIHTARLPQIKKGKIKAGDALATGWMGITLRILKFLPAGKESITYVKNARPTPTTTSAVRINFKGENYWAGMGSRLLLYTQSQGISFHYAQETIPLGFAVKLKDFTIGNYPGTTRAATYQSLVDVPGKPNYTISMNEPLHHESMTLYQSSFTTDESTGRPVASILSVNRDPGRWIKYLGCFIMVLGIIDLFYFRRYWR